MALEILSESFQQPGKLQRSVAGTETAHATANAGASAPLRERRRHTRGRIGGPHAATVLINEKNAGLVANVSEGGMRVQALGRRLEPGSNLRLQFQLPGSPEPIHTSGVVAWVNDSAEAGIRFAEVPESLARRLREWLTRNEVLNAARDFMKIAGGWQAALDLMAELTRILTGAPGVAITLQASTERPLPSPAENQPPVRATVAAPIYSSERIVGHLEISSTELGAFDEEDLGLLEVLAGLASEMIELRSARLREGAKKASALPGRIVSRIEAMFPTVRLRFVP